LAVVVDDDTDGQVKFTILLDSSLAIDDMATVSVSSRVRCTNKRTYFHFVICLFVGAGRGVVCDSDDIVFEESIIFNSSLKRYAERK
jgi:hypothetical protein